MERKEKCVNELYEAAMRYGLIGAIHSIYGSHAKIRLGFSKKLCDMPIEEISLSVRGFNALKRNGVNTLGEAIDAINEKRLMCFRNLGQKTAGETKIKIINYGYTALDEKEKQEFLIELAKINEAE